MKNFYKDLTPDDKQILRELASKHATFANEDAALEALKDKSDKLYKKAVELRNFVKAKIDSLKPDAKAFVDEVLIHFPTTNTKCFLLFSLRLPLFILYQSSIPIHFLTFTSIVQISCCFRNIN